jgi:IS5 family transposase
MLTKSSPISTQSNLFHSELFSQLDVKDPLIQLANTINWTVFDGAFEQHYSQDNGRPSKPIRLMVVKIRLKPLTPIRFLKCTNSVALQGIPSI